MCGCRSATRASTASPARSMAAPAVAPRGVAAPGVKEDGDVLAQFLQEWGSPLARSGRKYPVMQRGELWWVAPADVAAHPKWWRQVEVAQ